MRLFLIALATVLNLIAGAQTKHIKVLFLGNSYTYVNNLPAMIQSIAHSQGDSLYYDAYTPGGYTFGNHFYDTQSHNKISQAAWDYVVLQAQSQEPSFSPAQVNAQTLPFAMKLDSLINQFNPCANTVFYETWGRKNGDASNCAFYPPVCTYLGMQNRLRASYKLFADTVNDIMAPVGEAFRKSIASNSLINLYLADESHPSVEGTFLAACVFYETLFQKSVLSATYNPGLSNSDLTFLQQTAHQTVSDSLDVWNISGSVPKSAFTYTGVSSDSFLFQTQPSSFVHKWFFGDGSVSMLQNPSHTYSMSGNYTVSLVVYDFMNCKRDSSSQLVTALSTVGITELNSNPMLQLYPNPCSDVLKIQLNAKKSATAYRIKIFDSYGKLICIPEPSEEIDVSALKQGMYWLEYERNEIKYYRSFIKQN